MKFYTKALLAILLGLLVAHNWIFFRYLFESLSQSDGYRNHSGVMLGGDFIVFYQAAELLEKAPEKLYDFDFFAASVQGFAKEHGLSLGSLVYSYPPLFSYLISSLHRTSFFNAYSIWVTMSATLFMASLVILLRRLGTPPRYVALGCASAIAFTPFSFNCLLSGQTSACATVIFVLFYLLFEDRRDLLAGVVLALSYYKPPLFVVLVATLIFARQWRILAGFCLGGVALIAATVATYGGEEFLRYILQASRYRYGTPVVQGLSLPIDLGVGALAALEGLSIASSSTHQIVVASAGLVISYILGGCLRKIAQRPPQSEDDRDGIFVLYAVIVSVSLLLSFQMNVYDLSPLFPFLAGSVYLALRRKVPAEIVGPLALGIAGIYYEAFYRSVPVGGLIIKGTTIAMLLVLMFLWKLFTYVRRPLSEYLGCEDAQPAST